MAKSIIYTEKTQAVKITSNNIGSSKNTKFIVPMPGKGSWHNQPTNISSKKFHIFSNGTEDLALEDYRAQFLMEREYPID